MPWRNPATGLFESGNGPVDRRQPQTGEGFNVQETSTSQPGQVNEQARQGRGGNIHGGWDFMPTAGQPADLGEDGRGNSSGGEVLAVTDVLGVEPGNYAVKDSHTQPNGNFGPEAESMTDGPVGQGGQGAAQHRR